MCPSFFCVRAQPRIFGREHLLSMLCVSAGASVLHAQRATITRVLAVVLIVALAQPLFLYLSLQYSVLCTCRVWLVLFRRRREVKRQQMVTGQNHSVRQLAKTECRPHPDLCQEVVQCTVSHKILLATTHTLSCNICIAACCRATFSSSLDG